MTIPNIKTVSKILRWEIIIPFCVFVFHSLLFRSWLIDDAGISFAYARNLIHGFGLVSQAGVKPIEGFSNPLWTFLLSPIFIGDPLDPTIAVKTVSLLLVFFTFWILYRIVRMFLVGPKYSLFIIVFFILLSLAINTSFVVWTTSGLENPLYAFLCVLYCLFSIQYSIDYRNGARMVLFSGLIAAGLALTRPDGIIFAFAFPCVLVTVFSHSPVGRKQALKYLALFSAGVFVPVTLYVLFRYAYFGDWFPNTYYVKGGPSFRDILNLAFLTGDYLNKTYDLLSSMMSWRAGLLTFVLMICAVIVTLREIEKAPFIALFTILICSWAVYCLLPADWMGEYRFATPFFIMFYVCLFVLVAKSIDLTNCSTASYLVVLTLFGIGFFASSTKTYLPRSLHFAEKPTAPFSSVVKYSLAFNEYADILGIRNSTFLCPDAGGTLYFSRHRVYDLAGLCDRKLAQLMGKDQKGLRRYVLDELQPTFIHLHGYWSQATGLHSDDRFKRLYVPIWETPFLPQQEKEKGEFYWNGDYVRKDYISSLETLNTLRKKYRNGLRLDSGTRSKSQPFPRG